MFRNKTTSLGNFAPSLRSSTFFKPNMSTLQNNFYRKNHDTADSEENRNIPNSESKSLEHELEKIKRLFSATSWNPMDQSPQQRIVYVVNEQEKLEHKDNSKTPTSR